MRKCKIGSSYILSIVRKQKLKWYGHITRSDEIAKTILQGNVPCKRKQGGQKKRWEDNIHEWSRLDFGASQEVARDKERWREIVRSSS
jgi:hypothetical protein